MLRLISLDYDPPRVRSEPQQKDRGKMFYVRSMNQIYGVLLGISCLRHSSLLGIRTSENQKPMTASSTANSTPLTNEDLGPFQYPGVLQIIPQPRQLERLSIRSNRAPMLARPPH